MFHRGQQLLLATKKGSVGDVEFLLLGLGADVNFTNRDGRTPLMLYALLLSFVLDLPHEPTDCCGGWVGANRAASRNDIEVMKVILDRSADLDSCCAVGRTAVHYAAHHGSCEALQLLLMVCVLCVVCCVLCVY